ASGFFHGGTLPYPPLLVVQPEQLPHRLQQRVRTRRPAPRLLAQRRDRPVQQLVLEQAERLLDVLPVRLAQLAVEPAHQVPDDLLPPRLELARQPLDHRAALPPGPLALEPPRLLLDDLLGRHDVLAAELERPVADRLEVVDVEQAGAVAVVDARVEVARNRDVEDDRRPARPPGHRPGVALAADDQLGGPG